MIHRIFSKNAILYRMRYPRQVAFDVNGDRVCTGDLARLV